ncbi:class I SAM-dependent methyltransferase [Patescibacteria group bacterium]
MNYHRDKDYLASESQFRNIFKKRFNLIKKYQIGETKRVLDIGCSNGVFLDLFKEDGWETWGVEPSDTANAAKYKGHKVFKGVFEKAKLPTNFFDLVIMNHTLEHMDNPTEVLNKINKILKSKGHLFVDVPNAGGLGARLLGKHWPYLLSDEHKWQFTRGSLERLIKGSNIKVIHFESRSGLFEYANPILELWQSLIGFKKRFVTDLFLFPWSLLVTLFDNGDSMSIIGVKL